MNHILLRIIFALLVGFSAGHAQDTLKTKSAKQNRHQHQNKQHGKENGGRGFVDANGDGYNDNAPDDDGDGIPNGMDPDYVRGQGFLDLDGDGINDYLMDDDGDGIPNGKDEDFLKKLQAGKGKTGTMEGQGKAGSGTQGNGNGTGKPQHRGGRK